MKTFFENERRRRRENCLFLSLVSMLLALPLLLFLARLAAAFDIQPCYSFRLINTSAISWRDRTHLYSLFFFLFTFLSLVFCIFSLVISLSPSSFLLQDLNRYRLVKSWHLLVLCLDGKGALDYLQVSDSKLAPFFTIRIEHSWMQMAQKMVQQYSIVCKAIRFLKSCQVCIRRAGTWRWITTASQPAARW